MQKAYYQYLFGDNLDRGPSAGFLLDDIWKSLMLPRINSPTKKIYRGFKKLVFYQSHKYSKGNLNVFEIARTSVLLFLDAF